MVDKVNGYYNRLAVIGDCEDILRVHIGSIKGVCGQDDAYNSDQIDIWVGRQSIERYIDPIQRERLIVACKISSNVIIGFGHYEFIDNGVMEIKALYVSADYIHCGIGNMLMNEFNRVNTADSPMVVASTANAVRFYEKYGFNVEGETVHCVQDCVSINCIKMYKPSHPQ